MSSEIPENPQTLHDDMTIESSDKFFKGCENFLRARRAAFIMLEKARLAKAKKPKENQLKQKNPPITPQNITKMSCDNVDVGKIMQNIKSAQQALNQALMAGRKNSDILEFLEHFEECLDDAVKFKMIPKKATKAMMEQMQGLMAAAKNREKLSSKNQPGSKSDVDEIKLLWEEFKTNLEGQFDMAEFMDSDDDEFM